MTENRSVNLPRALVDAADGERRAFERALHDGVQQDLVAIAVNLQLVRQLIAADPLAATSLLDELSADVQHSLDDVRKLAALAHSPLLDLQGLMPALRAAAAAAEISVQIHGDLAAHIPTEVAVTAYRLCVAALAAIEGEDAAATIAVRTVERALEFEIGLTGGRLDHRALDGHARRLEALGGTLAVAPGRLVARLPLPS
jgi:signal transduction histidine kinase